MHRFSPLLVAALAVIALLAVPAIANAKPKLSVDDTSAGEAPGNSAVFTVSLSKKAKKKVKAHFETSPGTAGPNDFSATTGTVKIKKKKKRAKVEVPILGDTTDEPDETFTLTLSDPKRAKLGDETATGTIVDDDPPDNPAPDADADGVPDSSDNCVDNANPAQEDADADGEGDACDVCPDAANTTVCPPPDPNDADADGVPNSTDNCVDNANPTQEDQDADGKGDACDECPDVANPTGPCPAPDTDADGVPDSTDNCEDTANLDQADQDADGIGDVCDGCPTVANPTGPCPPELTAITEGSSCFETGLVGSPVATVHLSAPAAVDTPVAVTSDHPETLDPDSPATVQTGQSTATVTATAIAPGNATLTAELGADQVSTGEITVVGPIPGCP